MGTGWRPDSRLVLVVMVLLELVMVLLLEVGVVPVFPGRLFVCRGYGAARETPVCIAIGAYVAATITARCRAFQDSFMHRQD